MGMFFWLWQKRMTDRRAEAERPFSVATLAERWGCSRRHISNMAKRGELTAFRIGKQMRFKPEEVGRVECGMMRKDASPQVEALEI